VHIDRVLETCLYARDLDAARWFYGRVLGLELLMEQPGRHLFFRCGAGMLLVFDPEATLRTDGDARAVPHGATGPGHVAFAIPEADLPRWRQRIRDEGVELEAEVEWPRGGRSLYVRDPAGNSIELATPSLWG
jgi:catechol 2,3-dioxygenase-like lactoylglutathione lyase family enzyme